MSLEIPLASEMRKIATEHNNKIKEIMVEDELKRKNEIENIMIKIENEIINEIKRMSNIGRFNIDLNLNYIDNVFLLVKKEDFNNIINKLKEKKYLCEISEGLYYNIKKYFKIYVCW